MPLARRASLASVLLLFTGCISHGPVGSLPHIADPEAAAILVVIRPSRFVGAAGNVMATLDGRDVFGLGNGEHISVQALQVSTSSASLLTSTSPAPRTLSA
jgi:hypothetical protein